MAEKIRKEPTIRTKFRKYCRKIHLHLSYLFVGVILVYAISGITMNHLKDFNPQYMISAKNYQAEGYYPHKQNFTKEEVIGLLETVNESDNYKKHFYPNSSTMRVFLKSGSTFSLNTQSGEVNYEGLQKRPIFSQLAFLHYNPNKWWTIFSDIFAVSLIIICITGIFMNKGKKGIIGIGGIEILVGILIPILFLIFT